MRRLPIGAARRIAIRAQGLDARRPTGRVDVRHFRRVLDQMAVLQLDSVNVCCRSHYLPVLARLGPYDTRALDDYLWRSREAFEYLAHEASISPIGRHRLLRFRMAQGRWRRGEHLEATEPEYVARVNDEVRANGPLAAADLEAPGRRAGPWWGLSKGKIALERLYVTGRLAIHDRTAQFVTRYDLPERVIPPAVRDAPTPSRDDAITELVMLAARAHGIATAPDLADYFRLPIRETRAAIDRLTEMGTLEATQVDAWRDVAYLHPDATRPRQTRARALLSPFDPLVWFRPRAARLFDFEYRIEIYVPKRQRVHGYYVLPFLLDDRLVARVDVKADRAASVLRVPAAFAERGTDEPRVARELADALAELASWLDLSAVVVGRRGGLADRLRRRVG